MWFCQGFVFFVVDSHMTVCVYHISEGVFPSQTHTVKLEDSPYLADWGCMEPELLS